ncbi:hypothetical protein ACHWQZ_G016953 [Mnemiopsis leidyi]
MEFSINALNKMEDDLNSAISSILKQVSVSTVEDLNPTVIANKLNKNPLAKIVNDALKLMNSNLRICKSAAAKIDELKSEKLADQKALIECQQKQLDSVKSTVKTEMKTWSEIVKTNMGQNPSTVTLTNSDDVKSVLSRSNLLKKSPEEYFRKLYLAPDRTPEERKEHQKLVSEMKRRIESEPERVTAVVLFVILLAGFCPAAPIYSTQENDAFLETGEEKGELDIEAPKTPKLRYFYQKRSEEGKDEDPKLQYFYQIRSQEDKEKKPKLRYFYQKREENKDTKPKLRHFYQKREENKDTKPKLRYFFQKREENKDTKPKLRYFYKKREDNKDTKPKLRYFFQKREENKDTKPKLRYFYQKREENKDTKSKLRYFFQKRQENKDTKPKLRYFYQKREENKDTKPKLRNFYRKRGEN